MMIRGAVFLSILLGLAASMFMKKAEVDNSTKALNTMVHSLDPSAGAATSMQDAEKKLKNSLQKIMDKRYDNLGE